MQMVMQVFYIVLPAVQIVMHLLYIAFIVLLVLLTAAVVFWAWYKGPRLLARLIHGGGEFGLADVA